MNPLRSAAKRILLLAAFVVASVGIALPEKQSLPLDGLWAFRLDRSDVGLEKHWFSENLTDALRLPGSLQAQGFGDPVTVDTKWIGGIIDKSWFTDPRYAPYRQPGNTKIPFWLQPDTYYTGVAWYQREIVVPPEWAKARVVLSLERPHWETRVWIDDRFIGKHDSLATPHVHALGSLAPGRHRLTIRVDNRMVVDIGENSHSVSDHTQGTWNGIVGRIELTATPSTWIDDLQVYPDVAARAVRFTGIVRGPNRPSEIALSASPSERSVRAQIDASSGRFEGRLALGPDAALWDEFHPALHRLTAALPNGHTRVVSFGLREFSADKTQFSINGRPVMIRGALDCCNYPRTGHPPTDIDSWKRIIGIAKAHGLNLLRFHSWCPPEAAFAAADELGFFFHVEASSWPNQSTTLGDGKPVDRWINQETDRILRIYGNHPSFVLMAAGNEPGGKKYTAFLKKWVPRCRAADPRHLYTGGAGWPDIPENQWFCTPRPRIYGWGDGLKSRINARPPETLTDYRAFVEKHKMPVVGHETGQWCVYPNFDEIPKYTGYLKPKNFEIFRDTLRAHGIDHQAKDFLIASGKLQALCYKEDIETFLRTPGIAGFELLGLHDFPGQGTALVGVLDAFWEEKGYISPSEFRRFCAVTVPLARLSKRVFTDSETLEAALEVAHFGASPIKNASITWRLIDAHGTVVARGALPKQTIKQGSGVPVGTIRQSLSGLSSPARYKLTVSVDGTDAENDWDLWSYPAALKTSEPSDVLITSSLDAKALASLDAGGRVLLMIPPDRVRNEPKEEKVELGFSSIFWNSAWTRRRPPTTLGILCDPKHPALAAFPTDSHSNWQWWHLVTRARALLVDGLPREMMPIVQVIDDWFTARKLALVFETRVRNGRLLVCSIDLTPRDDESPVVRQFRASLFAYVASDRFAPKCKSSEDAVQKLSQ